MKILLSVLIVLFATPGNGQEQVWIDRLKNTPVARMEAGMAEKPFDQWLAELTRTQLKYEQSSCSAELDAPAVPCIIVSTEIAPVRKLELMFAIPRAKAGKPADVQVCRFLSGAVGPSDPRSKQPTRLLRKLSEVEALLR